MMHGTLDTPALPRQVTVPTADDLAAERLAAAVDAQDPETPAPLTYSLLGQTFTARGNRPAGAFAVFCARIKASDVAVQAAAPVKLLQAWTVPEDHNRLLEAMETVDDLEGFLSGEFGKAVEALAARPT